MSYQDMARSHVKELAREAFDLSEVVEDADGDLPFPYGTAMVYVSLERSGLLLRVWARAVRELKVDKAVLRELDETNATRVLSRVYTRGDEVFVEGCLPVETLRAQDLGVLLAEVGTTADRLGSMLAAVHGGRVTVPHGCAQQE